MSQFQDIGSFMITHIFMKVAEYRQSYLRVVGVRFGYNPAEIDKKIQ